MLSHGFTFSFNLVDARMIRWEYEGRHYVQFGLLQIAANPRLRAPDYPKEWWWVDPPRFNPDVETWLEQSGGVKWDVGAFGPPGFSFPSKALADSFIDTFDPLRIQGFTSPGSERIA